MEKCGRSRKARKVILSPLALRRCKTLRLLDHDQLPRSLWTARYEMKYLSIMKVRPGPKPLSQKITRCSGGAMHWAFRIGCFWATWNTNRDWGHARLCRGHVADSPDTRAGRLCLGNRSSLRCANSSSTFCRAWHRNQVERSRSRRAWFRQKNRRVLVEIDPRSFHPTEVDISFSAIPARRSRTWLEAHDRISTARIGHGHKRLDRYEETSDRALHGSARAQEQAANLGRRPSCHGWLGDHARLAGEARKS